MAIIIRLAGLIAPFWWMFIPAAAVLVAPRPLLSIARTIFIPALKPRSEAAHADSRPPNTVGARKPGTNSRPSRWGV